MLGQDAMRSGKATPLQLEDERLRRMLDNSAGVVDPRVDRGSGIDSRLREERGSHSQPGNTINESQASSKITPAARNQYMGAKRGDDEIEPLGSDEGDGQKSRSRDGR